MLRWFYGVGQLFYESLALVLAALEGAFHVLFAGLTMDQFLDLVCLERLLCCYRITNLLEGSDKRIIFEFDGEVDAVEELLRVVGFRLGQSIVSAP
ncbi:MAG: hypothetical protein IZT59_13150 [Verrucomicrobia bacterium]|nr:hypothetical protein [Verrucomicrobiota bacterium]